MVTLAVDSLQTPKQKSVQRKGSLSCLGYDRDKKKVKNHCFKQLENLYVYSKAYHHLSKLFPSSWIKLLYYYIIFTLSSYQIENVE